MECSCVGCVKSPKGVAQEYCDNHALFSRLLGIDFKEGSRYARAFNLNNTLAVSLSKCHTLSSMADNFEGVSSEGMIKMLSRRYGRG